MALHLLRVVPRLLLSVVAAAFLRGLSRPQFDPGVVSTCEHDPVVPCVVIHVPFVTPVPVGVVSLAVGVATDVILPS